MRLFLCVTTLLLALAGEASAAGRFGNTTSRSYSYSGSYSSSNDAFLYRGYNPGHIFGNTVRRIYWGPSMSPGR